MNKRKERQFEGNKGTRVTRGERTRPSSGRKAGGKIGTCRKMANAPEMAKKIESYARHAAPGLGIMPESNVFSELVEVIKGAVEMGCLIYCMDAEERR